MTAPDIFGHAPDGSPVLRAEIANGGATARLMTWGASLQDFRLAGVPHSLVLGCDDLAAYFGPMRYFGAIVGRVANRIAGGRAPLDGKVLELDRNEGGRTILHGGTTGSSERNWKIAEISASACRMILRLGDSDDGFPGNLDLSARYSLDAGGALDIVLEGRTDRPTFCALAHHSYWSLDGATDLSGHRLTIAADSYLPVDAEMIPLDTPAPVAGTAYDFRTLRPLLAPGTAPLDHNFCLRGDGPGLHPACTLETAGMRLEVSTDAPGLQVYDGAGLNTAPFAGHQGRPYGAHAGLALEPQHWPDAPNHPDFPPVVLRPGDTYRQRARFHVRRTDAPSPEETT